MTPYSDPNDKREWQKQNYRKNYGHKLTNQSGDPDFRAKEAFRKGKELPGWYGRNQERVQEKYRAIRSPHCVRYPIEYLVKQGKFWHGANLRTLLRWCSQGKFPAEKRDNKWYSSVAAIRWFSWQCANDEFRVFWRTQWQIPPRPRWWVPSRQP